MESRTPGPTRRSIFGAAGAVAAGLLAGCSSEPTTAGSTGTRRVCPYGAHQAGIVAPERAQPNILVVVYEVASGVDIARLVAELGAIVVALTDASDARLVGLDPGDVTITVGLGPRLVAAVDPALPGARPLDAFPRERIAERDRGGDLLVQWCATDPLVLPVAAAALANELGDRVRERWRQSGRRGPEVPVSDTVTAPRNVMGFVDGIVGPHTAKQQLADLWLAGPGSVAGGTIAVYRRMEIDMVRFGALSVSEQEAVFGRRRASGAPLSGGTIATDPDLGAKTPDGRYLIAIDAHARRANPNAAGVRMMLRRSYTIDDPGAGLLFISFQNELRTFATTLARMARSDALLDFTVTTASASFLILPGFSPNEPLGAALFGR